MPKQRENLAIHGGRADRFREIHEELEEMLGYEVPKTRALGHLLEHYEGPLLDDDSRR